MEDLKLKMQICEKLLNTTHTFYAEDFYSWIINIPSYKTMLDYIKTNTKGFGTFL